MKKRISVLAAVVLAVGFALCLAACGETKDDTVTVTLWHVYGGEVNSTMNALVDEFNNTVRSVSAQAHREKTRAADSSRDSIRFFMA